MRLVINANADATASQIQSLQNASEAKLPTLYVGDVFELQITFANGEGGYSSFQGRADILLNTGIGVAKDRTPYTITQTLEKYSDYYSAILDLATDEIKTAIGDEEQIELDFEIQLSDINTMTRTLMQKKVILRNQIIEGNRIAQKPSNVEATIL